MVVALWGAVVAVVVHSWGAAPAAASKQAASGAAAQAPLQAVRLQAVLQGAAVQRLQRAAQLQAVPRWGEHPPQAAFQVVLPAAAVLLWGLLQVDQPQAALQAVLQARLQAVLQGEGRSPLQAQFPLALRWLPGSIRSTAMA